MAWSKYGDETVTASARRKCWKCGKMIAADTPYLIRRGWFASEELTVQLHFTRDCTGDDAYPPAAAEGTPSAKPAKAPPTEPSAEAPADTEPAPPPGPSPEQREKLAHYAEIKHRNADVLAKFFEWEAAHAHAVALKKDLESMRKDLNQFIANGKDPQRGLDFDEEDDDDSAPAKRPKGEPEWKSRSVSVLGIPPGLITKLAEGAIETLGHLQAFWESGRVLTELKGIGDEKAATIADAWAEYAKTHHELYGNDDASGDDDDPFAGDDDSPADAKSPDVDDAGEGEEDE